MNKMQNAKKARVPETEGIVLHKASLYNAFVKLAGLGVNGANSRMVAEMAKIKPGDKILDVGCGTGDLTLTARKYAGSSGSACGIDASPEMIEVARKKAKRIGSDAIFELGLIEKLPFADATFDIVISRLVIHHLPSNLKRQGLKEVHRVLKPGGRFFIADFRPPRNHILAHLVGHRMAHSNISDIPPIMAKAGFVEISSGRTRSAFLDFVSGKKV